MKKKLITMIAAGALVLAACGSDSDGSDSGATDTSAAEASASDTSAADTSATGTSDADSSASAGDVQAQAADAAIASAKQDGIDLDADCVNELTAQLSDEDAQAIVDAGGGGDAEVSDEGTAIGSQLLSCAGNEQIIDALIAEMKTSGQEFDEQCVRDGLKDIDLAGLVASAEGEGGTPEEVVNAVFGCFDLGS